MRSLNTPLELRGKKVLVVGLGVQGGGVGVVKYLVRKGAHVTVTDLKGPEELWTSLQALRDLPVEYILGNNHVEDLATYDLLVRNPAVRRDAPILQQARRLGIPVTMEMNFFFRECPSPIVGVTGTKGKSTTASLVAHLLGHGGKSVILAGNLGISALEQLEHCNPYTTVVLELSSWQLEGLGEECLSPHVALVTRIFPDHMDAYPDFEAYLEAKLQIVRHQGRDGLLVVCRDDAHWGRFAVEAAGKVVTYSAFGSAAEVWIESEALWLRWHEGYAKKLVTLEKWPLMGQHNLSNLAGAVAAALALGLEPEALEGAVSTFRGLPHRLSFVGEVNGVTFVDDSAATVPEAAAAAVESFNPGRVILICGGSDKGLDPSPLAEVIPKCKAVALLSGSGTQRLRAVLKLWEISGPVEEFGALEDALEWCCSMADPGDVVLLSPGYASFGMFTNYRERGRRLEQWVHGKLDVHDR